MINSKSIALAIDTIPIGNKNSNQQLFHTFIIIHIIYVQVEKLQACGWRTVFSLRRDVYYHRSTFQVQRKLVDSSVFVVFWIIRSFNICLMSN